jgi:imidazoleglycerol phosphate synthase glutamine amidotransferase subunit HisH
MIDITGLKGSVDYTLEWAQVAANNPNGCKFHPDKSGSYI